MILAIGVLSVKGVILAHFKLSVYLFLVFYEMNICHVYLRNKKVIIKQNLIHCPLNYSPVCINFGEHVSVTILVFGGSAMNKPDEVFTRAFRENMVPPTP